jgi:hypothetical protein
VVFLYDPSMIVALPDDTSAAPILHTDSCVSIWTLPDHDGEVLLTLSDELADVDGTRVFEGVLETNGKRLAFNDSGVNSLLELAVSGALTRILLFTNDGVEPSSVTCVAYANP